MVLSRLHVYVSCLYSTHSVSVSKPDMMMSSLMLFFLLGNVVINGDYHVCLGSDSKYFNNQKLFPSVLLDDVVLRVTSFLIAACQICSLIL